MMEWVCKLFYETTDPQTPYSRIVFGWDVWVNIILHAFVYCAIFYGILHLLQIKKIYSKKQWASIWVGLILIMIIGYLGRLCRVKCLAKTLESDEEATRQLRNAYFVWYFIG